MEIKIRGNKRKEESSNVKKKLFVFFSQIGCVKKKQHKKNVTKKKRN